MTAGRRGRDRGSPSAASESDETVATESGHSRRSFLRLGTALAAGTAIAGCTTDAPVADTRTPTRASRSLPTRPDTIFMSDVARTGYWPDQSVPDEVTLDWSMPGINTGTHTAAKSSPLYHDGDVIVSGDTGTVYSVTPAGDQNWEASLTPSQRGTHSTPAVVDDYVFTAGYDGAVYAFDRESGDQRWRADIADAIGSSPVYHDGVVYAATEFYTPSGGMAALDAATGDVLWTDNRMTNHAHSITGLDTDTRRFAAGCNDGNLYVWNLDTWAFEGTFETHDPIKGPICMYDGMAIFGSWDGNVYAVDSETLTQEWVHDTDYKIMSGGAVHPPTNTVVIGNHGDNLFALDLATGDRQWTFETGGWIIGGVTVAGDTALVGSYDTSMYAVDVASGDERWAFSEPDGRVSSAPAVHDGDIYVTERADYRREDAEFIDSGYLYKLTAV
jgi:outer membrane protein assembly factor BamB